MVEMRVLRTLPVVTLLTYKVEPVEARLVVLRSTLAPLANEKGVTAAIAAALVAPVERRLAAVATPVLSMVEMRECKTLPVVTLLLYSVPPVDARLAAVATPVLSMVLILARPLDILAAFVAPVERRLAAVATPVLSMVVSLARSATIPEAFVAPVARRLAAVATPVLSMVEMRECKTFPVVTLLLYKVPPVDARLAAVATPVDSIVLNLELLESICAPVVAESVVLTLNTFGVPEVNVTDVSPAPVI